MSADRQDSVVKERFFELLSAGTLELTHLDYKRELFCKRDPEVGNKSENDSKKAETERKKVENENKKAEAAGYTKLLSHIMGMYNVPAKYGSTFPSINITSGNTFGSSYIIYGIDYKENKKTIEAYPIEKQDVKRGFIDERNLQDLIRERFNYPVAVNYYETYITESNIAGLTNLSWLKSGCYHLLEIIHDNTKGPVLVRLVTDKKVGRTEKNDIANKLYVHKQSVTLGLDSAKSADNIFEQEVWSKFDPKYAKYSNRLEDLKRSINPAQKAFKVLVMTPSAGAFKEEQKEMLTCVSNVKWNVIFDTDQRTAEANGSYDYIKDQLPLSITNLSPLGLLNIQNEGWKSSTMPNEVAHEKSCLYMLTNGDSTVQENCSSLQKSDVQSLSKILFRDIHLPVKLLVFVLILNPSTIKSIEEICKGINEAWDEVKEPSDTTEDYQPNSTFVFISYHESLLNLLAKYLPNNEAFVSVVAPLKQVADFFSHFQQENRFSKIAELPGSAGKVKIKEQDMKLMGKYFDLYYSNRGTHKWHSMTNAEMKENYKLEVATKFLQGFHLTLKHFTYKKTTLKPFM